MKGVISLITLLSIVSLSACSAKMGVPIPKGDGESRKHPSGTIIIIETQPKPKVEPRSH